MSRWSAFHAPVHSAAFAMDRQFCRRDMDGDVITDKSTGVPLFSDLAWFAYKVSGVMCSASACEHCWSVEGWIHSQRRNRLDQKLVEKLVRAHTNLVLRESLDDILRDLLPWDIEFVIDEPVDEKEEEPEG